MGLVSTTALLPHDNDFVHIDHALVSFSDDNLLPANRSVNRVL
jgi:predicted hotdog family 3-hydroxylacyl-ACP dehydratase